MGNSLRSLQLAVILVLLGGGHAYAETYTWATWTFPNGQTGIATVAGLGTATLTSQGPNTSVFNFPTLQFDNVSFTPTTLQTGAARGLNPGAQWGFTINLGNITNTNGLIVGLGNFGHIPGDPKYGLSALNASNAAIPLTSITQIGSYDHTWVSAGGYQFNDDVSLNTVTGLFDITTTPGLNNINSDILLMSLPTGVRKLVVQTNAPYYNDDTVNVILGVRSAAVPEPATVMLFAIGGLAMAGIGLSRKMGAHCRG